MSAAEQKVMLYLNEAHATEQALTRVLESQIAMTPTGTYRTALEDHHRETERHAERVAERLTELGQGSNPVMALVGFAETLVGQAVALTKTPLDLVRGSGGEEKVLKNAKDACATESLEIATYTALERLARGVGDTETAELAASIRAEEERMLERVMEEIPNLTDAMARAEIDGDGSYDIATTGAGQTVRAAGRGAKKAAETTRSTARTQAKKAAETTRSTATPQAKKARKVPGVAAAEGAVKGAVADEADLAIGGYDDLSVTEIADKLGGLSQIELTKLDVYERKNQNRSTLLERIETLRGEEPWSGYDELTVAEIKAALPDRDAAVIGDVRRYEQAHKSRAGVLQAVEGADD